MSEIGRLQRDEESFLEPFLPPHHACSASSPETAQADAQPVHRSANPALRRGDLPFVTVTYACSLDSMIAIAPGARTTLSGPQTKTMTHYLRLRHDAILIGATTAAVDDPGLNCRYPGVTLDEQPRPVILDPNRRSKLAGKKVSTLFHEGVGKAPWIVSRADNISMCEITEQFLDCDHDASSSTKHGPKIPWQSILEALKTKGINSVMVEGGAAVLNELLSLPELVDCVIITVAPTFLGQGGVVVSPPRSREDNSRNAAWLEHTSWRQFGNDVVLCGRPKRI